LTAKKIFKDYPGYIKGLKFDIYHCTNCDTNFINPLEVRREYYDWIYTGLELPGYDRYYRYMKKIIQVKQPLRFLSENDQYYYPVFQYLSLNSNKNLEILDIGCGYGYLTYSMKNLGHDVIGIDISSRAIQIAKKRLGDFFENATIEEYFEKSKKRFDLIVALEIIEHLIDPNTFLSYCSKFLKKNGKIIITTPNKSFFKKNRIWETDIPPIHTFWFSKNSLNTLAQKNGFKIRFISFNRYFTPYQDKLFSYFFNYFYSKMINEIIPRPLLDENGDLIKKSFMKPSFLGKTIHKTINNNKIFNLKIVRKILSKIYGKNEHPYLAALLFR